ncbi:MAG: coproporphyrinogen III oxidase family protein [bacterium]|nr:coproporphyrinogen III oxidase family protein [bacterium]
MLEERLLSKVVRTMNKTTLRFSPSDGSDYPAPIPGQRYMLYMHVPFCERLCPYCSFNRFPYAEDAARSYFSRMREEMRMLADRGFTFETVYVGGGTPTILMEELVRSLDLAEQLFGVKDVSSETNPNHLVPEVLKDLVGRVQRLSVGVQSFDNGLLKQMDRYDKYGSSEEIIERLQSVQGLFDSLNVDMIFNFPSQTEDMLFEDLKSVAKTGATQVTFYPLMASPSVAASLKRTVGEVDYSREERYYRIIGEVLSGGENPAFTHSSAWTFNAKRNEMIDEYIVDYEEYPAIGSGGITYLDGRLFINTFSLREYGERIGSGALSVMGSRKFSKRDRMRYRFMMQLFGMRLDKDGFKADFGCSVERGIPAEYAYMKAVGAFDVDDEHQITLTAKGRYLIVAMMREFFIGVNSIRDAARAALPEEERELLFGAGCPR